MDGDTITTQDTTTAEIDPWEKTDEALDAAAELMPECPTGDDTEGEPTSGDETADGGDA